MFKLKIKFSIITFHSMKQMKWKNNSKTSKMKSCNVFFRLNVGGGEALSFFTTAPLIVKHAGTNQFNLCYSICKILIASNSLFTTQFCPLQTVVHRQSHIFSIWLDRQSPIFFRWYTYSHTLWQFLYFQQRNFKVNKKDMLALYLNGSYPGKPCLTLSSCTKP